jgi:hypothetical protein
VAARDGVGIGTRAAHVGTPTSKRPRSSAHTSMNCIESLAFRSDLDAC